MGSITQDLLSGNITSATSGSRPEQAIFKSLSVPTLEPIAGKDTAGFGVSLKAGIPINRQDAIKVLSKELNIPVNRFVIDDQGNIGYKGDDGKYYPAIGSKAGFYAPDIAQTVADVGIGVAGSLTAPFTGGVGSSLLVGAGTAGTEALRQEIGRQVADSETSDPFRIGISGLLGVAGEGLPAGYKYLKGQNIAKDIAQLDSASMKRLMDLAEKEGIDLTTAEASDLASLISKQSTISRLPETATKMDKFYKQRYKQVQDAVDNYLKKISPTTEVEEAGRAGQEALINRRNQLKQQRYNQTKPLYDQALEGAEPVNTLPLVNKLDDMISMAKGRERQALEKIKKDFYYQKPEKVIDAKTGREIVQYKDVLDDRPQALQRLKMELDSYVKSDEVTGLDSVIQGEIKSINKNLKELIRQDNPLYKEADTLYAQLSQPIEEFDKRRAGASLTKISEDNLNSFAKRVFQNADPTSIRYAREQIEAVDPLAWKDVTRAWLQDNWEQSIKQAKGAKDVNLDAGLSWRNLLFGDQKSDRALKAALTETEYQGLKDLTDVLQAAGRVKKVGSDTAFNAQTIEQLTNSAQNKLAKILSPRQTAIDWLNQIALNKNANAFADIILDPKRLKELKELKKVPYGKAAFASGVIQLFLDSGIGIDGRVGLESDISGEQKALEEMQTKKQKEEQPSSITNQLLGL